MELTPEKIAALKAEHGELHLIEFEIESETETDEPKKVAGLFKKPTIKILSAVTKTAEDDKIKAALVMYNSTKVLVDPEIEASEELRMSAAEEASKLFKKYTGAVKKL